MKKRGIHIALGFILSAAVFWLGGTVAFLATLGDVDLILAASTDGFRVPRSLAAGYFRLARKVDVHFRTDTGQTLVAFTLAGYAEAKARHDDRGAEACLEIADMLVKAGVDVNAQDHQGLSPLHAAVLGDDIEETRFLVAHGADVNGEAGTGRFAGMTPVGFARRLAQGKPAGERAGIIEYLVQAGGR